MSINLKNILRNVRKNDYVLKFLLIMSVLLIVGLYLLYLSTKKTGNSQLMLSTLGIVFITSGLFTSIAAYLSKLDISFKLIDEFRNWETIRETGIISQEFWPIHIPRKAKKIDMLLIRGSGWFNSERLALTSVVKNRKCNIRIVLLHPNSEIITALAIKFDKKPKDIKDKIKKTIKIIVGIIEEAKIDNEINFRGRVVIKGHQLIQNHTYYRFDDVDYVVWYALRRGYHDVPLLKLRKGTLMKFFRKDFNGMYKDNDTLTIYDSNKGEGDNKNSLKVANLLDKEIDQIFPPQNIADKALEAID